MARKGQRLGTFIPCGYCSKVKYIYPGDKFKIHFCSADCKRKGYKLWHKHPKSEWKKGMVPWNKGLTKEVWPNLKGNRTKGRKSWSEGLTKETDERVKQLGLKGSLTKRKQHKISHRKGLKMEQEYGMEKALKLKQIIREKRLQQIFPRQSSIEKLLLNRLKEKGYKPVPQYPFKVTQIDVAFPEQKLAIYCDGDYWHYNPIKYDLNKLDTIQKRNMANDLKNEKFLKENNWKVLHFWETDIKNDIDFCINKIEEGLSEQ